MVGLESECRKQMQELVDEVSRKYQLKFQEAQAQYALKHNGLIQKHEKILMNKLLADAFNFNCLNTWSTWPLMQQGKLFTAHASTLCLDAISILDFKSLITKHLRLFG